MEMVHKSRWSLCVEMDQRDGLHRERETHRDKITKRERHTQREIGLQERKQKVFIPTN